MASAIPHPKTPSNLRKPYLNDPLKVIYIGGCGRSGSTLLDRMLGSLAGVVSVGELVHLIQRGLIDNELCGCGAPLQSCDFWSAVLDRTLHQDGDVTGADELRALQRRVDRNRYVWRLMAPGLAPSHRRDLLALTRLMGRLYRAIAGAAQASVVVDSSKHVSTACLLTQVPDIDLRVVHLVRDARGTAYSWTKDVRRPEGRGDRRMMHRNSTPRAAGQWLAYNLGFEALDAFTVSPTTRVIYERLVTEPVAQLHRIVDGTGINASPPFAFMGDDWVDLPLGHSVSGNPMRFASGRIHLRSDQAWRDQMPPSDQRLVTGITAPLLAAYGYLRR